MPRGSSRRRSSVPATNGGLIRDAAGTELLRRELPRGILAKVREVFSAAPVHPIFFRDEQLYCLDRTLPIRQFCDDEGLRAHVIPDPEEFLRLGAFMKGLFIGHRRDLVVLRADLEGLLEGDARLVHTAEHYLELLPVASTKGAALAHLAAHLGVSLDRVVAVGDHDNDLEMVEIAGLGVAMAHAPESVARSPTVSRPRRRTAGSSTCSPRSCPSRSVRRLLEHDGRIAGPRTERRASMPRVREIEDDGGDPILKEVFTKEREIFGSLLNVTKVYAHCPPILKAAKQLSASIERSGQLPAALLPLVYLRVALINGCPF